MKCRILLSCVICGFSAAAAATQEVASQKVNFDFEGNKAFSTKALREVAGKCRSHGSDSASRYESPELEWCLREIRLFLTGKGYLTATVGKPRQEQTESELRVIIPVEEGLPYRLGELNIQGAHLLSTDHIVGMLGLKRGDFATGDALNDWLAKKLKRAYADRGYIQFTYELEPHFRPIAPSDNEGIVDLSVSIEEGRAFTIRRVFFRGNSHTSDELLFRTLRLREGDTFSQELFDESIKQLNQLGLFEEINGSSDVDWKTSPNGGPEMDLIFHLKEKTH